MTRLIIERSNQFKRDVKKILKRGKNGNKLKALILKLANEESLDSRFRDHSLIGNYVGARECHIEPDWLLIYWKNETTIRFERTGSHSDLFS